MAQHSKAPWRAGNVGDAVVSDERLREQYPPHYSPEEEVEWYGGYLVAESIAPQNRPLIIAAPDLLEALEALLAITADSAGVAGYHRNGEIAGWDEFPEVSAARAAIAKAKGQSPA